MEEIRSFIAIELPEELRQELGRLQKRLELKGGDCVRWVAPSSIHLTLKFLGDIPADSPGEITAVLEEIALENPPFRLGIGSLGVFPNPKRVQVVWVGLNGDVAQLACLQKEVESRLEALGFEPEGREFTPHLTLGRVRNTASPVEREKLGQLITRTQFASELVIEANAINLMRSQLRPQGPVYTQLSVVTLGGKC